MSQELVFYQTGVHPCSYLANRESQTIFLDPKQAVDPSLLELLNLQGFRRSGKQIYRPHCPDCNRCESSRVSIPDFRWTRSFKRTLKKNADIDLVLRPLVFHQDHYDLFERYINMRHADGDMYPPSESQYRQFLLEGFPNTAIIEFRQGDQLVGCTVVDQLSTGLSALYTWFDIAYEKRGIGTLSILHLIRLSEKLGLPFVYLGYWIADSDKMAYKSRFKPLQTFKNDRWTQKID
jgi:arginyl-tRNA--protein-N-Asp/Glu arginylyltransferase